MRGRALRTFKKRKYHMKVIIFRSLGLIMYIELRLNNSADPIRSKKQIIFDRIIEIKVRVNKGTLEHLFIHSTRFFLNIHYRWNLLLDSGNRAVNRIGKLSALIVLICRWRSQIQTNAKLIKALIMENGKCWNNNSTVCYSVDNWKRSNDLVK